MQPTQLSGYQQWLRDNPPNTMGIVDELKSMLDPGNITGANAIEAAIKGDGMSTTKRITTGLSGIVQGLGFAAGGEAGKPAVESIKKMEIPAKIESGINKFNQTVNTKTGQTVYVHGSPVTGISELRPNASDAILSTPSVYGERPIIRTAETSAPRTINGQQYQPQEFSTVADVAKTTGYYAGKEGSLYVSRFDNKNLIHPNFEVKTRNASTKPVRVDSEITLSGKTPDQIVRELTQQLRKSGANIPKVPRK